VGQDVVLRIEVERDGHHDVLVVTLRAPTLNEYVPYVGEVRTAIARVVAKHGASLQVMFARMA
jgi:hypothetical protein